MDAVCVGGGGAVEGRGAGDAAAMCCGEGEMWGWGECCAGLLRPPCCLACIICVCAGLLLMAVACCVQPLPSWPVFACVRALGRCLKFLQTVGHGGVRGAY